jgi:hypothetical protein
MMARALVTWLIIMIAAPACGSTYHLKTGGWTLEATAAGGACLDVFGDGSHVARICIDDPEPLKIPEEQIRVLCGR